MDAEERPLFLLSFQAGDGHLPLMRGYPPSPIFPSVKPQAEVLDFPGTFPYLKHLQFILYHPLGKALDALKVSKRSIEI